MTTSLILAVDGSCLKNPGGPSGWAWVSLAGDYKFGSIPSGTNQVAELEAFLNALRDHIDVPDLTIQADSEYVINIYTKWMKNWESNGWRTAAGAPVKNIAQVRALRRLQLIRSDASLPPVQVEWVRGHQNGVHPLNDAADRWAGEGSKLARETGATKVIVGRGGPIRLGAGGQARRAS